MEGHGFPPDPRASVFIRVHPWLFPDLTVGMIGSRAREWFSLGR